MSQEEIQIEEIKETGRLITEDEEEVEVKEDLIGIMTMILEITIGLIKIEVKAEADVETEVMTTTEEEIRIEEAAPQYMHPRRSKKCADRRPHERDSSRKKLEATKSLRYEQPSA